MAVPHDPMHRYEAVVDLANANSSHTQIVLLSGAGKRVLEVGPATGAVTRALTERGCRVTGIEIDPSLAAMAAPASERMVVGDVEELDLREELRGERFEVVLFGDVLEHLRDPGDVLRKIHDVLAPGGAVIASIPNVAHASVRLALLLGRFRYTEEGLLDRTHLRFFTRDGVEALFQGAGYRIEEWRRTLAEPFDTEVDLDKDEVPAVVVEAIRDEPEALTYQFVVRAVPGPGEASPEQRSERPLGLLWAQAQPDAVLRDELHAARRELELRAAQIGEKDAAIEDRDRRLAELEGSRLVRIARRLSRMRRRPGPPPSDILPRT